MNIFFPMGYACGLSICMGRNLLYKYVKCETTSEEDARLADWLEADADNRKELDTLVFIMEGMALKEPELKAMASPHPVRKSFLRRFAWTSAAAAAAVLAAVVITNAVVSNKFDRLTEQLTTIEVPAGQRMSITLADGTLVWLNAGTVLEYPSVFSEKQRKVKVSGEALFEVEHDANRPFIVETFACDIEVLGTKFNVQSYEETEFFSTALMNGSVKLTGRLGGGSLIMMKPNDEVDLVDGQFQLKKLSNPDEYLWPEGIISITNMSFGEVVAKLERAFGLKIEIVPAQISDIYYTRGKVRVSDGIDRALTALLLTTNFTYTIDQDTGKITIK